MPTVKIFSIIKYLKYLKKINKKQKKENRENGKKQLVAHTHTHTHTHTYTRARTPTFDMQLFFPSHDRKCLEKFARCKTVKKTSRPNLIQISHTSLFHLLLLHCPQFTREIFFFGFSATIFLIKKYSQNRNTMFKRMSN